MIDGIFKGGSLELPASPERAVQATAAWGDSLPNSILTVVAVLLVVAAIPMYLRLAPAISGCMFRRKANTDLEHSLSLARQRNLCALFYVLPFCLIADRYRLFNPGIWSDIPELWSAPATIGVFIVYCLLRGLFFFMLHPPVYQEASDTIRHLPYNFFIRLTSVMLATIGICCLLPVTDELIRTILLWEIAVFFLLSFIRSGQFLAQHCSGLATFSYLCALEILPAALLVTGALLF